MTHTSFGRILAGVLVFGLAASAGGDAMQKGRYKKQGNKCLWDANDGGPNQCAPALQGRFKKSGDACVWDANDTSADDQCRPATGRFKKGSGTTCVWSSTDSGPDQCDPRQVK